MSTLSPSFSRLAFADSSAEDSISLKTTFAPSFARAAPIA